MTTTQQGRQPAAPPADLVRTLRSITSDLEALVGHITNEDHTLQALIECIITAAERIARFCEDRLQMNNAIERMTATYAITGRYLRLLGDDALDTLGGDDMTTRQHIHTALTAIAEQMDAFAKYLARVSSRETGALAQAAAARYSGPWEPPAAAPAAPPPVPRRAPQPRQTTTTSAAGLVALVVTVLAGGLALSRCSNTDDPYAAPAPPPAASAVTPWTATTPWTSTDHSTSAP